VGCASAICIAGSWKLPALLYPLSVTLVSCSCSSAGNIPSVLPAGLLSSSGTDVCPCGCCCWDGT